MPARTLSALLISISFCLFSCSHKVTKIEKAITDTRVDFLNDFVINPNPNNLDTVGIVFSIDGKGKVTPIANLNLRTNSDSVIVPKEIDSTSMTFGALMNFLKIKALDTAAHLSLHDSIGVLTSFRVENGWQTRYDLDISLPDAFESKRTTIENNIKFFGMEKNKLFLITETIRSPEVHLSAIRSTNLQFDAGAVIGGLLKLHPGANIYKQKDGGLSYKVSQAPVVFYKLRKINVTRVETKGNENDLVKVSLGDEVSDPSILTNN